MPKAIIVGSGPGGSVMAMELAEAGWDTRRVAARAGYRVLQVQR